METHDDFTTYLESVIADCKTTIESYLNNRIAFRIGSGPYKELLSASIRQEAYEEALRAYRQLKAMGKEEEVHS